MVGPSGLEPPTSRLSVVRSSQLSYGPIFIEGVPSKLNNVREKRSDLEVMPIRLDRHGLLRKEVIQPLVLERLPCYDFTPIIKPTFGRALSHGVTGGVYKARERIHRGMLIRDY